MPGADPGGHRPSHVSSIKDAVPVRRETNPHDGPRSTSAAGATRGRLADAPRETAARAGRHKAHNRANGVCPIACRTISDLAAGGIGSAPPAAGPAAETTKLLNADRLPQDPWHGSRVIPRPDRSIGRGQPVRGCPTPDNRLPSKLKHVSCGQRRGTAGAVIPPPSAIPP
jgi:hypothetical protein